MEYLLPRFRHIEIHYSRSRFQSTVSSASSNRIKQKLERKVPNIVQTNMHLQALPTLSIMPTRLLLRSLMITSILASPWLLNICLPFMTYIAKSKSVLLNPDRNPLLGGLMRTLFYNHFCAGRNDKEVKNTVVTMKSMGFKGVILGYAKEIIVDSAAIQEEPAGARLPESYDKAIDEWREGNLRTLAMISGGDFLAVKYALLLLFFLQNENCLHQIENQTLTR